MPRHSRRYEPDQSLRRPPSLRDWLPEDPLACFIAKTPKPEQEASCRMASRMQSKRGRTNYRKRKFLGEPPFAWLESVIGFDRFHLRGLASVTSEWELANLAANLRRMQRPMGWT